MDIFDANILIEELDKMKSILSGCKEAAEDRIALIERMIKKQRDKDHANLDKENEKS